VIVERLFADSAALIPALALEVVERLTAGVAQRGAASLVATGGTTPGRLYDALAQTPAPWDHISVTLSDERWVAADDPGSNEKMVRERLLQGLAAAAHWVPLKTPAATPTGALPQVEQRLAALGPPFDVVLLGMGVDGHVASLFPGGPELAEAMDDAAGRLVCAVHREGAAGCALRLSLTRAGLLLTRQIIVLIEGAEKLAVYRQALEGDSIEAMPIRMVLQQHRAPVQVWWAP
jgi:6-phosphogluconolactonase